MNNDWREVEADPPPYDVAVLILLTRSPRDKPQIAVREGAPISQDDRWKMEDGRYLIRGRTPLSPVLWHTMPAGPQEQECDPVGACGVHGRCWAHSEWVE